MAKKPRKGIQIGCVVLETIESDNATVTQAELLSGLPSGILDVLTSIESSAYGAGSAKRAPGDVRDFDKGILLSASRALRALADRMEVLADA